MRFALVATHPTSPLPVCQRCNDRLRPRRCTAPARRHAAACERNCHIHQRGHAGRSAPTRRAGGASLRFSSPNITALHEIDGSLAWSVSTAGYSHCQAMKRFIVSASQVSASALERRYWCRLAAHRAGTDIACETVCHIVQRGHAGRAGLPLALRANAPASPPNIAAFRMPATARWSASTAWSPLPGDTTRPNSLSGPTFGPSARVRAPCYGPENTAAAERHTGRTATRPAGKRGQAERARQWTEYRNCQRTRHHRFGTRAGQWKRRSTDATTRQRRTTQPVLRRCQSERWSADIGFGSLTHCPGTDTANLNHL